MSVYFTDRLHSPCAHPWTLTLGGIGGSPTLTMSRMSVYFTDTGISERVDPVTPWPLPQECSTNVPLTKTSEQRLFECALQLLSNSGSSGLVIAHPFTGKCQLCRHLADIWMYSITLPINGGSEDVMTCREGVGLEKVGAEPWRNQLRDFWQQIVP